MIDIGLSLCMCHQIYNYVCMCVGAGGGGAYGLHFAPSALGVEVEYVSIKH